jgi:two-component system, chemotaxis family, chemotaxis protein CheY
MKKQQTVLVAEDDPVFRRVIAFSLEASGFHCQTASNGLEAMEILRRGNIDMLVTDHQMPLCSGIEMIDTIRQQARFASLPIVLCTAKGFELNADKLVEHYQLLAVIRKPFSPRQMIGIVSAHLLNANVVFAPTAANETSCVTLA